MIARLLLFVLLSTALVGQVLMHRRAAFRSDGGQWFTEDFQSPAGDSFLASSSNWTVTDDGGSTDTLGISDESGGGAQELRVCDATTPGSTPDDNYEGYTAIYQTQTDTVAQWGKLEIVDNTVAAQETSLGIYFRGSAASSGTGYYVTWQNDDKIQWQRIVHGSSEDLIQTSAGGWTRNDGDWLVMAVIGTGASTVVKFWEKTSDPGTDYSALGAATWTSTQDPTDVGGNDYSVDTGNYIGIRQYLAQFSGYSLTDNWGGGDQ